MELATYVGGVLERNEHILFSALDGATDKELNWQPSPDTNPMGWLVWHLSRVQDTHVSVMQGKEQAWTSDGWHTRFGMEPDASDRGAGHTSEQVAAFRAPDLDTLLAYYRAVREYTQRFLDGLTPADLEREVPAVRGGGMVPLEARLEMVVVDNVQHSGQVAYLRGLIRGKGWFSP